MDLYLEIIKILTTMEIIWCESASVNQSSLDGFVAACEPLAIFDKSGTFLKLIRLEFTSQHRFETSLGCEHQESGFCSIKGPEIRDKLLLYIKNFKMFDITIAFHFKWFLLSQCSS